ncbi:MAG TPA: sugar ABC transporter substrate-binding protein [Actinomycetota bacterium]|nr:sugar ABC transporter substrate-binding protein [Actinomycetota bacterium]
MIVRKLFVAGLAFVLVACQDQSSPTPGEPVTITVQVSGEREETAVYRAAARAFENDNPDITVEPVEIAEKDDHLTRLATSFSAGVPPDVFLVNFREYTQFVSLGGVEPLDDYLDDVGIDLANYYPAPVEAFTFDGALQCMPQNASNLAVYFNTDLFAEAGIDPPFDGWSWEGFRSIGEQLTKGDVRGIGIEPSIIRLAPFVWSNGGEVVDDLESPTTFTLDDPSSREALEFLVGLVKDGLVPTEREIAAQDLETRFSTGKLAMLLSSRRDTPAFREVRDLNFDVLPLPQAGEPANILHSDGYCIAAQSDAKEAAARFIGFVVGSQGQTITALGGRTVPSLMSIAQSPAFLDPSQEPAHSQVFLDAVPHLRRTPVLPNWPEIEDVAEEILTRAFYEPGFSIDNAIELLKTETEPLFKEASV